MKKFIILILAGLVILVSTFTFYLYSASKASNTIVPTENLSLQSRILANSIWIDVTEQDFIGYLNGTYTETVQRIINSLEEATPLIIKTSNDKFGTSANEIFVVASAFNTSNQVYVYYFNAEKNAYLKTLSSLESLLEDAISVYIYNEKEGV